jgi:hypothetical protein
MNPGSWFRAAVRPVIIALAMLTLVSAASAEWKEKVLYSFQGGQNNGSLPAGGVVFDKQGNLYVATTDGGPPSCAPFGGECGAVYELSPPAKPGDRWTATLIRMFKGNESNDASVPTSGLILDTAGNLYGVTGYGGTGNCVLLGVPAGCGTVYELSPPRRQGGAWKETILYSFPTAKQGYLPNGNLVFDSAGNLYGATEFGGGKGTTCNGFYQYCGAVFELSPPKTKGGKWTEKVLHSFAGGTDGANPNGGLVFDTKGAIYGTTPIGGDLQGECNPNGCGIVFALQPPTTKSGTWTEKLLHRFNGNDGATPAAGVIFGVNGDLYGTASAGATNGSGLIFELKKTSATVHSWAETVLHAFHDGNDGAYPMASLIVDASGNIYGTALGGETHRGVVFRLKPPAHEGSWPFTVLYNFSGSPDGAYPETPLIFSKTGLYGTTQGGGTGKGCGYGDCGTVFKVSP